MPSRVRVSLSQAPYDVVIEDGLLVKAGEAALGVLKPGKCAVVTDTNVGPLYAATVADSLRGAGFFPEVVTVDAGEASKSLRVAGDVCDRLIAAGLDRSASVIALGGGVVGDLAGFIAAIYYRGIPYVQIPTTVVSQVDSSVGGKTGVNAPGGKNLIGAFHQPRLVLVDPATLESLPRREYQEGLAEVIKHAAIRDPDLLQLPVSREEMVRRNIEIKARIVEADEFETKGLRALLNFGHTIGHGIENAGGYGRFLHGEAISLGLVAAVRLSVEKSGLTGAEAERVLGALRREGLPVVLPKDVPTESILGALRKDKKFHAGAIRFVLLRSLGEAFVSDQVHESDIVHAIEALR